MEKNNSHRWQRAKELASAFVTLISGCKVTDYGKTVQAYFETWIIFLTLRCCIENQ